jgi:hypothetical protein
MKNMGAQGGKGGGKYEKDLVGPKDIKIPT